MTQRSPIPGPCGWRGRDIASDPRWLRDLGAEHLAEIDAALAAAEARGIAWRALTAEGFSLPGLDALLREIAAELEDGCGMVKLRGLPVERYTPEALRLIWFAI